MKTTELSCFKASALLLGLGILIASPVQADDRYVAVGGTGDGTSWATAYGDIQTAVTAAGAAGTVYVSNGTYTVGTEVLVNAGITVKSFNNENVDRYGTIVQGNYPLSTNRCFRLTHADAVVEGFTITNGCVSAANGGGVYISSGTLRDCLVTGNVSTNNGNGGGGGVYLTGANSVVTNCEIIANATYGGTTGTGGGGVKIASGATLWDSHIQNNKSPIYWAAGGGIHSTGGNIFNCTVISNEIGTLFNKSGYSGGGIAVNGSSTTTIRNCLIKGNDAGSAHTGAGIFGSGGKAIVENCTVVENFGRGIGIRSSSNFQIRNCISMFNTREAINNENSTLTVSNCCLTATNFTMAAGSGNFIDTPAFQDREGGDFRLSPWSVGVDQGLALPWMDTARDLAGNVRLSPNGLADVGAYETSAAAAPTYYVARAGQIPSPTGDYTSWSVAASNLQDAAQVAPDGSTILVSNGVYTLNGEIDVKLRTIRGFNDGVIDPATVIIDGNAAGRCFSLPYRESLLEGLTITNGLGLGHGGGVYMVAGTMQNCIVAGNTATNGNGGGVYATGADSHIIDCEIVGNLCIWNSQISSDNGGGGVKLGGEATLRNSWIAFNNCSRYYSAGGGVHASGGALVENCQIISNQLGNGYAVGLSNTHGWGGGGVWVSAPGATLRNCLILGNPPGAGSDRGAGVGGAAGIADIQNCTIVGNFGRGLGASNAGTFKVLNTIAYNNSTPTLYAGNGGTLIVSNSCVSATNFITASSGVFTNDPQFVSAPAGNFRLRNASPCVDAGLALPWMVDATDLDGNRRVDRDDRVDLGCYELIQRRGTVILVH